MCSRCGGPTKSKYGVCWRNPECRLEYDRRRYVASLKPKSLCGICGGLTRSRYGACLRTPECKRERQRRKYAANREAARERSQRYYAANREAERERQRRWCKDNPERRREHIRTRDARKRAVPTAKMPDIEIRLLIAQDFMCPLCGGRITGDYHLDHIIPLARGGWHVPGNVQVTHPHCNQSKRARLDWTPEQLGAALMCAAWADENQTPGVIPFGVNGEIEITIPV